VPSTKGRPKGETGAPDAPLEPQPQA